MKKIIIGVSFLLASIVQLSALTCVDLKTNLKRYNESSDVLALQNFLVDKGFLNAKPNGYFGNGTLSAVKKYQESIGLSRSGQVFPLTRAMIKKETCETSGVTVSNTTQSTTQNTPLKNPTSVSNTTTIPSLSTYSVGANPYGVTFDSNTKSIWTANYSSSSVTKLNAVTGAVIGTYAVGDRPVNIIFESSTNSIWVANSYSNSVTKLNTTTGAVIGTYTVGERPVNLAFDSSTNSIWVANSFSNNVTKLNVSTGAVVGTSTVGRRPSGITFEPLTNSVWVTNSEANTVTKLNASTGAVIGTYTTGIYPLGVVYEPVTKSMWIANYNTNNVTKLSALTGDRVGTHTVGSNPNGITFDTITNSIWVANRISSSVTKLNPETGEIVGTHTTGTYPNGIILDSSTNAIWTANYMSNNVTRIAIPKPITTNSVTANAQQTQTTSVVALTPNQQRQKDVTSILNAMYTYYLDSYKTFLVPSNATSSIEICALGVSSCGNLLEIKSVLVPRFLSSIPVDPSNINVTGTGYFVIKNSNGDVTVTAPRGNSGTTILATCNFLVKCVIATSTTTNTVSVQTKPQINSIDAITLISGGSMTAPMIIRGAGFSTSSNTILFTPQNSQKTYTLGTFSSATGTSISAVPSFTVKPVPCGTNCSETVPAGNYNVIVRNQGGESNAGYISVKSVKTQTTPNSPNASFMPKSTHVKLATYTLSSSVGAELKAFTLSVISSSTIATKVSNFTLTDVLADKIINGGPSFTFKDTYLADNQTKIYELYADIADIVDGKGGQVYVTGNFTLQEYLGKNNITVPVPEFLMTISY